MKEENLATKEPNLDVPASDVPDSEVEVQKPSEDDELNREFHMPELMKFVGPSIFAFVFIALYQMVDGIFIERYVGSIAIGAVNLYYPILGLFCATGIMLGTGGNAMIVKMVGEGKRKEADRTFSGTVVFAIIISLIYTVVTLVFSDKIMRLCGATDVNIVYLRPYYTIMNFGCVAILLQSMLGIFIIGEGRTISAAVVIMIGGILNCVLDYVFMNVFHWGIRGAAIATVIGYVCTVIYAIWYFIFSGRSTYRFRFGKLEMRKMGTICFNGSSDMISNLAGGVTAIFMNHYAQRFYGEVGVSALSVVLYYQFFIVAVFMGYTSAVEPIFSYHYGTGNKEVRKRVYKLSIIWNVAIQTFIVIIVMLFRKPIVGFFFEEGEYFDITLKGLDLMIWGTLFVGLNSFISGLFTAFSNGLVSGFLSALRTLVLLTICLIAMSEVFGANGLWLAWPVAELLSVIVSFVFVRKYKCKYGLD